MDSDNTQHDRNLFVSTRYIVALMLLVSIIGTLTGVFWQTNVPLQLGAKFRRVGDTILYWSGRGMLIACCIILGIIFISFLILGWWLLSIFSDWLSSFIDNKLRILRWSRTLKFSIILLIFSVGSILILWSLNRKEITAWRSYHAGIKHYGAGRVDDVLANANKGVQLCPKSSRLHNILGLVYFEQGRYEEALKEQKLAAKFEPSNPRLYYYIANAAKALGKYDEAINVFEKAIKISRDYPDAIIKNYPMAHVKLGNIYEIKRMYDEAIKHYLLAIQHNPNLSPSYHALAKIYIRKGLLDQAIILLNGALAAGHSNELYSQWLDVDTLDLLGEIYTLKGMHIQAEEQYRRMIAIAPRTFLKSPGFRGYVESICRTILARHPSQLSSYHLLGMFYNVHNQYDKAIEILKRGLEVKPDATSLRQELATAYEKLGLFKEALSEWNLVVQQTDDEATKTIAEKNIAILVQKVTNQ